MAPDLLPKRRSRVASVALIVAILVATTGGGAAAAIGYDRSRAQVLLPGTEVGGVQVGGLAMSDARAAVADAWEAPLDQPFSIKVDDTIHTATPRELGASSDALARLDEVAQAQREMLLPRRVWHRLSGRPAGVVVEARRMVDEEGLAGFVAALSEAVHVAPVDAAPELTGGFIRIRADRTGFGLDADETRQSIEHALVEGAPSASLTRTTLEPAVRRSDVGTVLLVRVGENKLYHYRGERLIKVYDVATGKPSNPTPKGRFTVINKRRNPTWVNPAPRGWGANMPARIGPGPNNPLGTRALDINSPGIRIHGTAAVDSIGYNASQGCVRMRRADVEELFELVPVGTPVFIVQAGSDRVPSSRTEAPQEPEPSAESDATPVA